MKTNPWRRFAQLTAAVSTLCLMPRGALADEQSSAHASYTLERAVSDALANHPRIRASVAEESAAEARIDEARTARLPDVGLSAQINRSTGRRAARASTKACGRPARASGPRGTCSR